MISDWRECKEENRKVCIGCVFYDECDRHSTGGSAVYGGISLLIVIAILLIIFL